MAVPGRHRGRAARRRPAAARARAARPRDDPPDRRRPRRPGRVAGEEPRSARRPRGAGRTGRARDDAWRPPRLARPRGARARRRGLGDGDARRVLDPPHHGGSVCRADRARSEGAARRPARRSAPGEQAPGVPRPRRRVLVRDQGRHCARRGSSRPNAASWSRAKAASRLPGRHPSGRRTIGFALWMALARATPVEGWRLDDAQLALGAGGASRCRRRREGGTARPDWP